MSTDSYQNKFHKHVKNLSYTISDMGNPFLDDFAELVCMDTCNCANDSVTKAIMEIEELGKNQYQTFVKDVLADRTVSISKPIRKNNLPLFKRSGVKAKSKVGQELTNTKRDANLFSQMFIVSQVREGDMGEFPGGNSLRMKITPGSSSQAN